MHLWNDIRYGLRTLRKSPGFTATAVVTLALGIGATTATFSVADAMLWKPIALPDLDRLVAVVQIDPGDAYNWIDLTPADAADIRQNCPALSGVANWDDGLANLAGPGGEPERVPRAAVTLNFYDIAGVRPVRGRAFQPGEDQPGAGREVILSDRLWRRRFGADPEIVGKTIRVDDQDHTVIGIMPPRFQFPLPAELWTPLTLSAADRDSRRAHILGSIARLAPGASVSQAGAQLSAIAGRLERLYPASNRDRRFRAIPGHRYFIGEYNRQYVSMLFYAVLFVLLIACVNVANLQFARATGRIRELAIRTAMGAGRWRLITQLVTESIVLSVGGALFGLLIASWGLDLIRAGMPPEIERYVLGFDQISLDGRTMAFAFAAAVASGILAGIAPAWHISNPHMAEFLKEGGRGSSVGRARHRLRSLLVVSEIALAVVLLVGAGLMVRGFRALIASGIDREPGTLLTMRIAITPAKYGAGRQVGEFYRQVLSRISTVPGVRGAAVARSMPYAMHMTYRDFTLEGRPPEAGHQPAAVYQPVSPNFYQTLHVPLRAGRFLSDSDGPEAPLVAVIGERTARLWWPGEPFPIGRRLKVGAAEADAPWLTIVGVVGDIQQDVFDSVMRPAVYVPYLQAPSRDMDVAVRTAGDPLLLVPGITAAVRSVDAEQPISDVRTMAKGIRNDATGLDYVAVMMSVFGAIALALSTIGVYGVMAYMVSEQTHEIGIRMALGASRESVLAMIFRRGMTPAFAGLAIGMTAAFALARLLASLVFGVPPDDRTTFIGIPLALILSAALALYVPARRAMSIDPMGALRHE